MTLSRSSERRAPRGLAGVRVALLEARMGEEMSDLLGRYGAIPRAVAAVREEPIDCAAPVAALLARLATRGRHMVIFLTGVGADAVFQEAERQAQLPALLDGLREATLVCRGPKPSAAIRRRGLAIDVAVAAPYTSHELLLPLESMSLDGVDITLVHYGERNARIADAITARGAVLHDLCVYEWRLPDDLRPLQTLVRDILEHQFDAVMFTSQIQGRHLLHVAEAMQLREQLVTALNKDLVVSAMGPVCKAALEELGITPHVVPAVPKMAPLVSALAEHFTMP
jgi:uroporphyrinogen-III synthase